MYLLNNCISFDESVGSVLQYIALLLAAILFIPIPAGVVKDGGTRVYAALTYKIVDWNRLTGEGDERGEAVLYQKTAVYWFPENLKDLDELWQAEMVGEPE